MHAVANFRYSDVMLAFDKIAEVAQDVARQTFGANVVKDIRVKDVSEWTGEDALEVLVILQPPAGTPFRFEGKASAMLSGLGDRLYDLGENRFAHVRYATQQDLGTRGGA